MYSSTSSLRSHILYLSHGGGPMPLLGDPGHQEMVDTLKAITTRIPKPSAIILVSAHWEADRPTITQGSHPFLIYDYYGFPEPSYQITYPAPGHPKLADTIATLLEKQGIKANLTEERGFDHGLFVPLKIMYPDADIPCIEMSLVAGLEPKLHIEIGKTFSQLSEENLLIIGSGFSFHNMQAFRSSSNPEVQAHNLAFEQWLVDTCSNTEIDENERTQRLIHWQSAPSARYCHPREEHLLPLHVCYGAAQRACTQSFELTIMGKRSSMYLW